MARFRFAVGFVLPALVLCAAAVAKAAAPGDAYATLDHFLDAGLARYAVTALILVEWLLAAWLVLGGQSRSALAWTMVLFAAFCAILVYLLRDQSAPTCGCFGLVKLFHERRTGLLLGLARNLTLLAGLCWAWSAMPRAPSAEYSPG